MNENPVVPANSRTDFGVLLDHANLGVGCFESLIACLLAAAETGREQYSGQLGWIDEIRRILSWPQSGLVYWVNFRDTVLFVTQALIGGKLLECGEGKTAYNLATTKVEDRYGSQSLPVYKHTLINGWPDSLGHTCTIAWSFLTSIIENWGWLKHASGSPETIKEGIVAYYFLMDFLGFVSKAKEGPWKVEPLSTPVTAPQNFFAWPANAVNRGYAYFLNQIPLLSMACGCFSGQISRDLAQCESSERSAAQRLGTVAARLKNADCDARRGSSGIGTFAHQPMPRISCRWRRYGEVKFSLRSLRLKSHFAKMFCK
jgi:hypothetical protein